MYVRGKRLFLFLNKIFLPKSYKFVCPYLKHLARYVTTTVSTLDTELLLVVLLTIRNAIPKTKPRLVLKFLGFSIAILTFPCIHRGGRHHRLGTWSTRRAIACRGPPRPVPLWAPPGSQRTARTSTAVSWARPESRLPGASRDSGWLGLAGHRWCTAGTTPAAHCKSHARLLEKRAWKTKFIIFYLVKTEKNFKCKGLWEQQKLPKMYSF